MKRHLSVLMLASRTIWRVLAILLLTAAVQTALFAAVSTRVPLEVSVFPDGTEEVTAYGYISLESCFNKAHTAIVGGVGFVLMCFILCVKTSAYGSRVRYTVARLRVGERGLNLWWAVYHAACMMIFWLSQIMVTYLLCRWYMSGAEASVISGQTVAIAYYRNTYLHNLMPGGELVRWARNLVLAAAMGLSVSRFAMVQRRRGTVGFGAIVAAALVVVAFCTPLSDELMVPGVLLAALVIAVVSLSGLLTVYRADEIEPGEEAKAS